jgi:hypothetical protein
MFLAGAAFVVAVSTACNPMVALSHDSVDLASLRNDIGHSSALAGVSVVDVKGRLATVEDGSIAGADTGKKWSKSPGPAAVMQSVWAVAYIRNNPTDLYRTFTFVEVLNARGQHVITLSPPECS